MALLFLTIVGRPVTKKNSLRRLQRGVRTFTVPSAAHETWVGHAVPQLQAQWNGALRDYDGDLRAAMAGPVNLSAQVFRDRDVGDLGNYLAAVCDALEGAGVVADDKLIQGFDGSRLKIDRENPRVEIMLTPMR